MEVYTLDSSYRRENVVDDFMSLIWTERFNAFGDFELLLQSTPDYKRLFAPDTWLAMNNSSRLMKVETTLDKVSANGEATLSIKGRSFEAVLLDRLAKKGRGNSVAEPNWIITDTPGNVMRKVFHDVVMVHVVDDNDGIPYLLESSLYPPGTISEPATSSATEVPRQSIYEVLKSMGELYDLGFRILRGADDQRLYFDVYSGNNRTTSQSSMAPVVFSPELDNLQDTSKLMSTEPNKTVAYVVSPTGFEKVYALGIDPNVKGPDRRVLYVDATSITETGAAATAKMIQMGKEELAKNRSFAAFDGEINQNSMYKYGLDYDLGDLVELRDTDGTTNVMRVTEQIFVSDKEGDRSYPTLSINNFITPGSWLAWDALQNWADLGVDPVWSNQT